MVDSGHQRLADAVLHLKYLDVLFQGIGARQIVIVFVLVSPDDPAGLHLAPGDRFEAHAHLAIAEGGVIENRQGIPVAQRVCRNLRQHIRLGGRRHILDDLPTGRPPVIGHGHRPFGRSLAQRTVIEGDDSAGGCREAESHQPGQCPHTCTRRGNGAKSTLTLIPVVAHCYSRWRRRQPQSLVSFGPPRAFVLVLRVLLAPRDAVRPNHVLTSVADTITTPPASAQAVGRSP